MPRVTPGHSRFVFKLSAVLLGLLATSGFGEEASKSNESPTVWSLNDLSLIGGTKTEVLGRPKLTSVQSQEGVQFDGHGDALILPAVPIAGWNRFTIEVLFNADPRGEPEQRFVHLQDAAGHRALIELRLGENRRWCLDTYLHTDDARRLALIDRTKTHAAGEWSWAALTYADGRMAHFVNGVRECEGEVQFGPMEARGQTSLGVRLNRIHWFKGTIREVRFHPKVLPTEELQRAKSP